MCLFPDTHKDSYQGCQVVYGRWPTGGGLGLAHGSTSEDNSKTIHAKQLRRQLRTQSPVTLSGDLTFLWLFFSSFLMRFPSLIFSTVLFTVYTISMYWGSLKLLFFLQEQLNSKEHCVCENEMISLYYLKIFLSPTLEMEIRTFNSTWEW